MELKFDLLDLMYATIPLWVALFAGAWTLLRFMVFQPLHEISEDLKEIKSLFSVHEQRIIILEYKLSELDKAAKPEQV